MAAPILLLGHLSAPLMPHLLRFAHEKAVPAVQQVLTDPDGFATRIGDVVVWNGSGGQQVLAGLQSLVESQPRIEQAVTSIESAQLATTAALSSLQVVSFATLGVASLAGGTMLWRLEAINKRFDRLSKQIADLEENLDAQNKAHLRNAIQKLREFDDTGDQDCLLRAKDEAQHAVNVYGQLAYKESQASKPRLNVLNYRGRCYLISLVTELRARLSEENATEAITRFSEERSNIEALAKATFEAGMGDNPALFLCEEMKTEGATLELMTEVYQHAARLGAFNEAKIRSPADMFEYCRGKGIAGKPFMRWKFKRSFHDLANRLKYVMACFEDIGRAESLQMIAGKLKAGSVAYRDLQKTLGGWCQTEKSNHPPETVFSYAFA